MPEQIGSVMAAADPVAVPADAVPALRAAASVAEVDAVLNAALQRLEAPTLPTTHLLRDNGDDTSVVRLRVDPQHEPAFGQQVRAGQAVLGAICLLGCSETEEVATARRRTQPR